MMKKIHTNTLIPMVEEDCLANLFYIVIGTHKEKGNTMYDVISSRYERTSFTEEKVKTLLDMHIISAGAKLENGAVVVASLKNQQHLWRMENRKRIRRSRTPCNGVSVSFRRAAV